MCIDVLVFDMLPMLSRSQPYHSQIVVHIVINHVPIILQCIAIRNHMLHSLSILNIR